MGEGSNVCRKLDISRVLRTIYTICVIEDFYWLVESLFEGEVGDEGAPHYARSFEDCMLQGKEDGALCRVKSAPPPPKFPGIDLVDALYDVDPLVNNLCVPRDEGSSKEAAVDIEENVGGYACKCRT